jgi:hypothetical protein
VELAALHVPTTRLVSDSSEEGAGQETIDRWAPVRGALVAPLAGDELEEPTLEGVRDSLKAALPLFAGDRFAELGSILPRLLRDANVLAEAWESRAVSPTVDEAIEIARCRRRRAPPPPLTAEQARLIRIFLAPGRKGHALAA